MPASLQNVDQFTYDVGIYYCKCQYRPYGPFFNSPYYFYHLDWEHAITEDSSHLPKALFLYQVQGRSCMADAINSDLLMEKEVANPIDTTKPSYIMQNGYFLPALFRIDSSGNTRWAMTLKHLHSKDFGLYHAFNALSVAPDGKIVLVGYLKSQYPVSGYGYGRKSILAGRFGR